jgi:hypothetical protein
VRSWAYTAGDGGLGAIDAVPDCATPKIVLAPDVRQLLVYAVINRESLEVDNVHHRYPAGHINKSTRAN